MTTAKDNKDVEDREEGDGCGVCLLCRYQALLGDMEDALEMLRRGERKKAEHLLCVSVADAEEYLASGDWADEEDEEDEDDEFGLASMVTEGRA